MTFKIANILVSSLCLLVDLSCYAQDEAEKQPSRLRARISHCIAYSIDLAFVDAISEGEEEKPAPPAPRKSSVRSSFHTSAPNMIKRSSRLVRPGTPKKESVCPRLPPIGKEKPADGKP